MARKLLSVWTRIGARNQRVCGTPDSSGSAWREERFCRINPAFPAGRGRFQTLTAMRKMSARTLAGVWSALISRTLGFELNLHDFSERHHDFLFCRALGDLHMHFIGGDARDALDNEQRAPRFHGQHQIFFRFAPDHGEETGKLRLKKTAVERELSALKNLRRAGPSGPARRRLPPPQRPADGA